MAEDTGKTAKGDAAPDETEPTPIDVPAEIQDGGFDELTGDARVAFLDTLFTEVEGDALGEIRDDIVSEVLELNKEITPDNVDRMELLQRYLGIVEAEGQRRQATQKELDTRAAAVAEPHLSEHRHEDEDKDEDEDQDLGSGSGDDAGGGGDQGADDKKDEGEDGDGGGDQPPVVEAEGGQAAVKPSASGLTRKLADNSKRRKGGSRVEASVATVVDETVAPEQPEDLARKLLGFGDADTQLFATNDAQISYQGTTVKAGDALDSFAKLGEAFWVKHRSIKNRQQGFRDDRLYLAQAAMDFPAKRRVTMDALENFGVFTALREDLDVIVASGGSCAPAAPRFDIFRLAEPQSPVEDNLPVLQAPRGAINFVVPPNFRDVRAGVGVTTDPEDANPLGYGSGSGQTPFKPCVHVDCAPIDNCVVDTVSTCIEFGNLTFETFPEFVAARMADLAVNFVSIKEILYLNGIDVDSTTQTYTAAYGISRAVPNHVATAAHNYRKGNNMDIDGRLDWYAPDWLAVGHQIDKRNDQSDGVNQMPSIADVAADYAVFALNVVWYYDSASGAGQAFSEAITDGPGNAFPTEAIWYLHAPGTFVRLDAGTLDVGLVRDSSLNRTNDLQFFAEQWTQICKLGLESVRGVSQNLCPSGAAPEPAELLTCDAGS